ncbi:limb development membrane protein 1 like, partial [Homo sapiens]
MEAPDYEVLSVREQLFHERIRECIISTLLFATLYILCHIFLTRFKKPAEFTTGLWNLVFLFSNLSLIFLMPFAYFFTES